MFAHRPHLLHLVGTVQQGGRVNEGGDGWYVAQNSINVHSHESVHPGHKSLHCNSCGILYPLGLSKFIACVQVLHVCLCV